MRELLRRFWQSLKDDPLRDYQRAKELLAKGLTARPEGSGERRKPYLRLWKRKD
jgi:hypothetical protein